MKRCFRFMALAAVLVFVSVPALAELQLNFSTGSMGGGFYAVGSGISDYITKHVPGIIVTAVTSGGVNENINRLDSGQAEIGLVNTIDPPLAFKGEAPYKRPYDKMRGMGILYLQYGQPYVLKNSGIKTYLDIKGKVVCAGSPGGSMHQQFFDWAEIHGLKKDVDYKAVLLPAREAMEALKAGQVDVVMEVSTLPTPGITEIALTHDVALLEFAPGYREKLIEQMPKYLPMSVPAGTYKGQDKDVETVGSGAMWACRADLSDNDVYEMVKSVYSSDGLDFLKKVHAAANGILLENAAKWRPIPLHPGAEKFFKENNLIK